MITADVKCPRCEHTELVEIKLNMFKANRGSPAGSTAFEIEPEIMNLADITSRFEAHYDKAHQTTAVQPDPGVVPTIPNHP